MTTRAHAFALDIIANAESGGTQFAGTDVLELARAYVGMGWQPIESAPRDGGVILLYCPSGKRLNIVSAFWDGEVWVAGWADDERTSVLYWINPTHWMPLPGPPSEGRDE